MADRSPPARSPKSPLSRGRGLLRRFTRAQDGAAAIEFAFVAIPFLILVFSIVELGLVFLVSMTLENALNNVDRKIRTGEFQTNGGTAASFKTAVCGQMSWLASSCPGAITLDVRSVTTYTGTSTLTAPAAGKTCWDPGGPSSIVLVRGYYKWPLITPLMQSAIGGTSGNRLVPFAAVFANEPYSETPATAVTCPT
jgi:Flp pilus assembly protein TadG